jgi:GrpB-like predicted nucleotidyltransferase (UPF0157 family)
MDEIILEPPNPDWPRAFEREKADLLKLLPKNDVVTVHHFGSTAVPNLPAKPIIDILIEVTDMEKARSSFPVLMERAGYDFWRDNPKLDRLYFVKGRPPKGKKRTHHVHVGAVGGELSSRLLFRDFLIKNPEWRDRYAALKLQLAKEFAQDREAYTDAKSDFVSLVMSRV